MTSLTLVAVHGNGGGAFRFARAAPFVPAGVRLHAVTLPGFADRPADPALRVLADYGRWLAQALADVPRPRVGLGTGIGGTLLLEMLQQQPATLDGLILHAPVGTRLDTRRFPRLMRLPAMTRVVQYSFSSALTRPLVRRLLFHRPLPIDYTQRFFDEYRRCRVFGQMFRIITPDWFAGLRPLALPAALLWGEQERILRVDQLDDYRRLLPNHRVRVVPAWDHFPMIETPAQFMHEVTTLAHHLLTGAPPAQSLQ